MAESKTRLYLVTGNNERHLVRADNKSQAIRAVAERTYKCEVADTETALQFGAAGGKVLDARSPQVEMDA